jgi:hypothetical protein
MLSNEPFNPADGVSQIQVKANIDQAFPCESNLKFRGNRLA